MGGGYRFGLLGGELLGGGDVVVNGSVTADTVLWSTLFLCCLGLVVRELAGLWGSRGDDWCLEECRLGVLVFTVGLYPLRSMAFRLACRCRLGFLWGSFLFIRGPCLHCRCSRLTGYVGMREVWAGRVAYTVC